MLGFALIWFVVVLVVTGIARLGRWQAWLLALGGLLYFCCAGLYAFYDKPAFDVQGLLRPPAARTIAGTASIDGPRAGAPRPYPPKNHF